MIIRDVSANAFTKALVLIILLITILTATAAAADYHPGGYDKECTLCQINTMPLAETAVTPVIPDNEVLARRIIIPRAVQPHSEYSISLPGRSPPAC